MERSTRSGHVFSAFMADLGPAEIIQADMDVATFLQTALVAADLRAAAWDEGSPLDESEDSEWEDVVDSRPPSPLSELSPSTRSTSPEIPPSPHNTSPEGNGALPLPPQIPQREADSAGEEEGDATMPMLLPHPSVHLERRRQHKYARRREKRAKAGISASHSPYTKPLRSRHDQRHREQPVERTDFDAAAAYTSGAGAWVGSRGKGKGRGRRWHLEELKRSGARHIRWDGRSPKLIVDCMGRIIAILLGRPKDPDWDAVVCDAAKAFHRAHRAGEASGAFRTRDRDHRGGVFTALAMGVSFGGGQKRPGNLVNGSKRQKIINSLLNNKSLRRIAGFQSSGMARYAPKLWRYYADTLQLLFKNQPGLTHNFSNSIFPASTFNLGPEVVTDEHADINNCVGGLCGVTSFGEYKHKLGGQIYLKEIKMVIDFPSGASVLIPSAFVHHGNTPIQRGESRLSFTQYAAGGLFRWVKYGFRTAKSLLASVGGAELVASIDGVPGSRWEWALDLFSKHEELEMDRQSALGPLYI